MGGSTSTTAPTYRPMDLKQHGDGVQPGALVAVTGATGFIGSHVVRVCLNNGYNVRACVRDPTNADKLAHLRRMTEAKECKGTLEFMAGDLLQEGSYDAAFTGVDAVIHCAAVVSNASAVKDPMKEIVDPSVVGSRNVYASVDKCPTVKRVVHTSSIAAIQTYDKPADYKFSEADWNTWSTVDNADYYGLAKTRAEEIAHRAAESAEGKYDVAVINPGIVFGECLTKAHTKASPVFVRELIYGNPQADVFVNYVNVKDVADAHVEALRRAEAGGQRFVLVSDNTDFTRMTARLSELFPEYTFTFNARGGILFDLAWYTVMSEFERQVCICKPLFDSAKSQAQLGIQYTDLDTTLRDTVQSMVNWVKPKAGAGASTQ